jgi:hypothetical protein
MLNKTNQIITQDQINILYSNILLNIFKNYNPSSYNSKL